MIIYARASEISTDGERQCFSLYTVELFVSIFHSIKVSKYHGIQWNAVTSLGENKVI